MYSYYLLLASYYQIMIRSRYINFIYIQLYMYELNVYNYKTSYVLNALLVFKRKFSLIS